MSKTIKNLYNKNLTFNKLYEAYQRSAKNKGNKKEVLKFNIDLESNLCNILKLLKEEKYLPSKYHSFTIYEPKERLIKALPFKDRIVQQWYIYEFIIPYIIPRFIKDSYACIKGKGTHKAVNTVKFYMNKMKNKYNTYYVLKCDIKKYFYSVNKDILFNIMKEYIKDKKLLNLTKKLIYDGESLIGLAVGNYTSQYFANIYLNKLDYYIKFNLKIKYYVRYCDDFVILLKNKEESKRVLEKIRIFLKENLNLELNKKSRYYKNIYGINFCGYRIFEKYKLLRNRSKRKIKKNVYTWNKEYLNNKLDYHMMRIKYNSFLSYSKHADSYRFRNKIYNSIIPNIYL